MVHRVPKPKTHRSTFVKLYKVSLNFIASPTSIRSILQIVVFYSWTLKPCSHLTSVSAFASNLTNGFYGNIWWYSYLMFAFWQQGSKRNSNADVKCEQGLKTKLYFLHVSVFNREMKMTARANGRTSAYTTELRSSRAADGEGNWPRLCCCVLMITEPWRCAWEAPMARWRTVCLQISETLAKSGTW